MGSKIAVTGANGQLGQELKQLTTKYPDCELVFLSRDDLPVDDEQRVKQYISASRPDFLINCAAYTAVDKAETDREQAWRVNAEAAGILAAACKEYHTKFVHISTDYVFDGTASVPYKPDSLTNPQGYYGVTKLEGERLAAKLNPGSIIIRTSWVYSEFGKNFVKTMIRLMSEKEEINVVSDQVGSPTYAADLATAILQIVTSGKWKPGLYHFSNEGVISWYDFALAIKELTSSNCKVNPIPTSQYPTPAKRPSYSVLDNSQINSAFGIELKKWRDSLKNCLLRLQ